MFPIPRWCTVSLIFVECHLLFVLRVYFKLTTYRLSAERFFRRWSNIEVAYLRVFFYSGSRVDPIYEMFSGSKNRSSFCRHRCGGKIQNSCPRYRYGATKPGRHAWLMWSSVDAPSSNRLFETMHLGLSSDDRVAGADSRCDNIVSGHVLSAFHTKICEAATYFNFYFVIINCGASSNSVCANNFTVCLFLIEVSQLLFKSRNKCLAILKRSWFVLIDPLHSPDQHAKSL